MSYDYIRQLPDVMYPAALPAHNGGGRAGIFINLYSVQSINIF